jgi:DNA-binding response OmpR family regulator
MKILLIEDERIQRMVIESMLAESGHEILTAENGEEGWRIVRETGVRMVVTDWFLPLLNGPDLVRRIRGADLPGYVYVILVSARDSKDDMGEGMEAGADDSMTKPFSKEELMTRLMKGERVLELRDRVGAQ